MKNYEKDAKFEVMYSNFEARKVFQQKIMQKHVIANSIFTELYFKEHLHANSGCF
jgi:hypothetical protein